MKLLLIALFINLLFFQSQARCNSLIQPEDIDLFGQWEILLENGDKAVWTDSFYQNHKAEFKSGNSFTGISSIMDRSDKDHWKKQSEIKHAWFVKNIVIPRQQSGKSIILNIGKGQWARNVWFNESNVGSHLGGYSPTRHVINSGIIKYGQTNRITIKMSGWPTIPKSSKRNKPLIMRGPPWGKGSIGIHDGIWMEFFKGMWLKNVKIETSVNPQLAQLKIWVKNTRGDRRPAVAVVIRDWKTKSPVSKRVFVQYPITHKSTPEDKPLLLSLPCPKAKIWRLESPNLYEAVVTLEDGGTLCQEKTYRFGFRTFEVKKGQFLLNGIPIMLRGPDLFGQDRWAVSEKRNPDFARKLLIDLQKNQFNCNVVRTHTSPMADDWLDICDEGGMLVFSEFPITVNFSDWKFTREEYDIYHDNSLREMKLMIPHYWNRPSIITWVMSNESHMDHEFENGPMTALFRKMDSTRPLNRSCFQTDEMADVHGYCGVWKGTVGNFNEYMDAYVAKWGSSGKVILNSEYIGHSGSIYKRFTPSLIQAKAKEAGFLRRNRFSAIIFMEETEHLRLLSFDGILPYVGLMGDYKTGEREYKTLPAHKAIRNAFEPVMVSMNTLDRHFISDKKVKLKIGAANDLNRSQKINVIYGVTEKDPGYDYHDTLQNCFISKARMKLSVPPTNSNISQGLFTIPAKPGKYYFLALAKIGNKWIMSHRPFFALNVPESPAGLSEKKMCIIENGNEIASLLKNLGCKKILPDRELSKADLAIVGWNHKPDSGLYKIEPELRQYVLKGGKLIVLEQDFWHLSKIVKVNIEKAGGNSGAEIFFPLDYKNPLWKGIDPGHLWRLNGQNQAVYKFHVTDLPENAKILAEGREDYTDKKFSYPVVEISLGKGRVLFYQIKLKGRLDRKSPDFDPVALRLFYNLLSS